VAKAAMGDLPAKNRAGPMANCMGRKSPPPDEES